MMLSKIVYFVFFVASLVLLLHSRGQKNDFWTAVFGALALFSLFFLLGLL